MFLKIKEPEILKNIYNKFLKEEVEELLQKEREKNSKIKSDNITELSNASDFKICSSEQNSLSIEPEIHIRRENKTTEELKSELIELRNKLTEAHNLLCSKVITIFE